MRALGLQMTWVNDCVAMSHDIGTVGDNAPDDLRSLRFPKSPGAKGLTEKRRGEID
jgi:hypothetical protein